MDYSELKGEYKMVSMRCDAYVILMTECGKGPFPGPPTQRAATMRKGVSGQRDGRVGLEKNGLGGKEYN